MVCPDQVLTSVTYPTTDTSNRTLHQEVAIAQSGVMNYTAHVSKYCHCTADIMIAADDKQVDTRTVLFSKSLVDVVFNLVIL